MQSDTLIYQDQSAAALRLNVLEGVLDLGAFTCLASGNIGRPELQIQAHIIGASHIVQLDLTGGWRFSEILACTPIVAHPQPLFSQRVAELPDPVELELAEGVFYHFSASLTDSHSGRLKLETLEERIVRTCTESKGNEMGLRYDFPSLSDYYDPPTTLVWIAVDEMGGAVAIETAHSYPHEDALVFSKTQVCPSAP